MNKIVYGSEGKVIFWLKIPDNLHPQAQEELAQATECFLNKHFSQGARINRVTPPADGCDNECDSGDNESGVEYPLVDERVKIPAESMSEKQGKEYEKLVGDILKRWKDL